MSQNPLMDSGTRSSKTPSLQPPLAAALASLEVQLDQELARYRRKRMGARATSQPRVGNYISTHPQDTTNINTTSGNTQPPIVEIKTNVTPASLPETRQERPISAKETQVTSSPESFNTQIPLPLPNSSSIVPAIAKPPKNDSLLADDTPPQPDDYLESSEALLRSLTDEQPQTNKPSNSSDSLLSPLGIGSMLLLLVASLTLGYVVFNPKGLPQLNLGRLFNSNSSPSPANPQDIGSNSQPQVQPELTTIPKYPNLAAKEFPEVKDPSDVVGLQPKAQPTTVTPINPIVVQTPLPPLTVNPLPPIQPLPPVNLPPISTIQTPIPVTTTSPKANVEITPAADGFYHLVTDNKGSITLLVARQVVPDAYLSRDNTLIYLGALKTKAEAEQRLRELQVKGIKARVGQP